MPPERDNLILQLCEQFALAVMDFADILVEHKRFVFADQLLRSGTSVGAHMTEAQNAQSRADFLHKCKIAAQEAGEAAYWLRLCRLSARYPTPPVETEQLIESIQRVLSKILGSTRRGGDAS